jgi:hypothetical protein
VSKTRSTFQSLTGIALAAALALATGCADRTHLRADYGGSVHGAFAAQAANPDAGRKPGSLPGLDGQEASIIARNYYMSLTPKATTADDRGMLLVAPTKSNEPFMPAPSVPQDRK